MTRRISGALAAATVMLSLGTGHTAVATALYSDDHSADSSGAMVNQSVRGPSISAAAIARRNAQRELTVFGATPPEPLARAFSGEHLPATFGSESQNAQARMMEALDTLILAVGVMSPPADQLNLSINYGTQAVFSTGDGISQTAMMLPGFDIGSSNAPGSGRGPSPATVVPEPATGLLLLAGALGLIAARRR